MAYFAKIEDGIVANVIRVANADMVDGEGNELIQEVDYITTPQR